jgi:hypothetical protein
VHDSRRNGSRGWNRASCGPRDNGKFGILLNSSPADRSTNFSPPPPKKKNSSHLLEQYAVEGDVFLHGIMTGDES